MTLVCTVRTYSTVTVEFAYIQFGEKVYSLGKFWSVWLVFGWNNEVIRSGSRVECCVLKLGWLGVLGLLYLLCSRALAQ